MYPFVFVHDKLINLGKRLQGYMFVSCKKDREKGIKKLMFALRDCALKSKMLTQQVSCLQYLSGCVNSVNFCYQRKRCLKVMSFLRS